MRRLDETEIGELKNRIKVLCDQRGIKYMKDAFLQAGVGKNFVSNLSVSRPQYESVKKLADFFGVSVEYLIDGSASDEPPARPSDAECGSRSEIVSESEFEFLQALRKSPELVPVVRRVLDMPDKRENE